MLLGGSGLFREEGPTGKMLDLGDYILKGGPGTLTPRHSPSASQPHLLVLPPHSVSTTGPVRPGEGPPKAVSKTSSVLQIAHLRYFSITTENLALVQIFPVTGRR